MRIVLFLIGLALSADGLYCGFTGSMGAGEALIVAAGIVFILWSTFYDAFREKGFLRFLKGLFVFVMAVFVLYSGFTCLYGTLFDTDTGREDYVIVLGAGLSGNEPSQVLKERLDKAVTYLNRNSGAEVIVSGGRDKGAFLTEAQAMSTYLVNHGVDEGRILLDETATSTYENFLNAEAVVGDSTAVFITSNFHVLRSAQTAGLCGIKATHIGATVPLVQIPVCCAREMAAEIASIRYYIN